MYAIVAMKGSRWQFWTGSAFTREKERARKFDTMTEGYAEIEAARKAAGADALSHIHLWEI